MTTTVEIAFDLNLSGAGNFITLDEPIKGQLDDADYPLAGETLVDVTQYVRGVTVNRGRPAETQVFDAGTCAVRLDNSNRLFDPTAAASISAFAAGILPRKEIVVSIDNERIFTGQVEDWDISYEPGGDSVTTAKGSDAFTITGQQVLASGAGFTGTTGSVISQVLSSSAVDWPVSKRNVDTGAASIGAHTIENDQNALTYMQKISDSEPGALFIGRDGFFTFRERLDLQTPTGLTFTDDGTGIGFASIEVEYGTENLYTRVEVEWASAPTVVATNTNSVDKYGLTTLTFETYLATQQEAEDLAVFYAERYGNPTYRVRGLSLDFDKLTSAQKLSVSRLELGDVVTVRWTPSGVGDALSRVVSIDEIQHSISPGDHIIGLNFSETLQAFVLDDLIQGVLDQNYLAF